MTTATIAPTTTVRPLTVATEIRRQIGRMTMMAVGARDIVGDKDSLMFRVTVRPGDFRKIIVTLMADDTYTVKLIRINKRTLDVTVEQELDQVYCDALANVVYRFCTPN